MESGAERVRNFQADCLHATLRAPEVKVLLIGEIWAGSLEHYCQRALRSLGHEPCVFNTARFTSGFSRSIVARGVARLTRSLRVARLNHALLRAVGRLPHSVDIVIAIKGISLFPETLRWIKRRTGAVLCDWHTDDYFDLRASSKYAFACIPIYDCIFTAENFNIPELGSSGARRVQYLPCGYDPDLHRPGEVSPRQRERYSTDVVFIGSWRADRAEILEAMVAEGFERRVSVWGSGWTKLGKRSPLRPHVRFEEIYGEEMPKAIWGARIALAFVTRFGRGGRVATMRTFEIPACGGFMLAERASREHHEFFEEGTEMVCFDGVAELGEKVEYYLEREPERAAVGQAGRDRLLRSGYSYRDRVSEILRVCNELR